MSDEANIKNIFDYKAKNDPQNILLDSSIKIGTLESYSKLTLEQFVQGKNNTEFRLGVGEAIKKYCVNDDFAQYKKKVFPQASNEEYGDKISELATKQEQCHSMIGKASKTWVSESKTEINPAFSSMQEAMEVTKNKIILDRKVLVTIDNIRTGKDTSRKLDETLPLSMFGSKFLKSEELTVWRKYDQNKLLLEPEVSFLHKSVSWIVIILTVIAVVYKIKATFFEKNSQNNTDSEEKEE